MATPSPAAIVDSLMSGWTWDGMPFEQLTAVRRFAEAAIEAARKLEQAPTARASQKIARSSLDRATLLGYLRTFLGTNEKLFAWKVAGLLEELEGVTGYSSEEMLHAQKVLTRLESLLAAQPSYAGMPKRWPRIFTPSLEERKHIPNGQHYEVFIETEVQGRLTYLPVRPHIVAEYTQEGFGYLIQRYRESFRYIRVEPFKDDQFGGLCSPLSYAIETAVDDWRSSATPGEDFEWFTRLKQAAREAVVAPPAAELH